ARLWPVGDEHEAELGPLPPRGDEDRAIPTLVLDRHELVDRRPVLHLDERVLLGAVVGPLPDAEVGGEVLAAQAQRRGVAMRLHGVPRAAEDRFDEGFRDPALDLEEIHATSALVVVLATLIRSRGPEPR